MGKINNSVILVTFEQFEYLYKKVTSLQSYNFFNPDGIMDGRRTYFADRGYPSFWFKTIPVVSKRLKKFNYLDLRNVGNNFSKFRKKVIFEIKKLNKIKNR